MNKNFTSYLGGRSSFLLRCTVFAAIVWLVGFNTLVAQQKTISGTVTSKDNNKAIGGVTVKVKGGPRGAITQPDGKFTIVVPESATTLVFEYVGMKKQEVPISSQNLSIAMEEDALLLDEIVVTGVAEGVSQKKVGFSVAKVGGDAVKEAPAVDVANSIRGKVAGVQIVQPTGIPGTVPQIRLRGATNIQGNSTPLIIIDGVITTGGLQDINLNDIESMEFVKGAAGASFYGSQAANGVVQIVTKRGAAEEGKTEITLRSEWGVTDLQKEFPINKSHNWRLNADGSFLLTNPSNPATRQQETDLIHDNAFPGTIKNHQRDLLKSRPFNVNSVSLAGKQKNTNFLLSFERLESGGIMVELPPYERLNGRLNIDHQVNEKLTLSASLLYSNAQGVTATERQQGGPFYGVLLLEPDFDLFKPNPDGTPYFAYPGRVTSGNNGGNPLYSLSKTKFDIARTRILSNVQATYKPLDWVKVVAAVSYDRNDYNNIFITEKDTYLSDMSGYSGGGMSVENGMYDALVPSLTAFLSQSLDDFTLRLNLRYQYEQYTSRYNSFGGNKYAIAELEQLSNLDQKTFYASSSNTDVRAETITADFSVDYQEKIGFSALIRRDGTSLFGEDQRYQTFFRGNVWIQLNEFLNISEFQDIKLRAGLGTTGQRPGFSNQYETFSVSNGIATKSALGNRDLRPSKVTELEVGTDFSFLNMFKAEFNYAKSVAKDQIIFVPLPSVAGFTGQWQNAGTMENNTIEVALTGNLVDTKDFKWDINVNASRTRQTVTELNRAPYKIGGGGGLSSAMFYIKPGEDFGVMYGNIHARSLNDLITDASGNVINLNGVTGRKVTDFTINSDGYVILAGTEGKTTELAYMLLDTSSRQLLETAIGNSNPDLILGVGNTVDFMGFRLYVLVDAQFGGNVYNATKQLLYFNNRHGDMDQAGKPDNLKKAASYYTTPSSLYNGNNPVKHFVEDGGFVTIREVSLSYTLGKALFTDIGMDFVKDMKISLIGRNLFTFSNYSGYNPEVAMQDNSVNFRVDQYTYPVFRTFTAAFQLRF